MTPLERAARALADVTIFWDETYDGAFVVKGDPTRYATNAEAEKAQAKAQVRAVIEAIREPSEAMVQAYADGIDKDACISPEAYWIRDDGFSAMIDALLEEGA